MAQDRRRVKPIPPLEDFKVGMANSAREGFDENVLIVNSRHFQLFDSERLMSFVKDGGFHFGSLQKQTRRIT
jgi:hypothetical protein